MIAAGGGANNRYGVSGWLAGAFSVVAGAEREGGRERTIVESKTALVFGTSAWRRNSYAPRQSCTLIPPSKTPLVLSRRAGEEWFFYPGRGVSAKAISCQSTGSAHSPSRR